MFISSRGNRATWFRFMLGISISISGKDKYIGRGNRSRYHDGAMYVDIEKG